MFESFFGLVRRRVGNQWGAAGFGASSILLNLATMACGIAILRWIGPELIGFWVKAQLLRVWMDALRLGVVNGLNRELPEILGQGQPAVADAVAATALAMTGLTTLAGLSIFGVATFLSWSGGEWDSAFAVLTAGIAWASAGYGQYVTGTLRSVSSFRRLSQIQFFEASLMVATLVLVAKWGFHGLCLRGVLLALMPAALLHLCRPLKVRPKFSAPAFRRICSSGLPQYVTNYLLAIAGNADRTLLLTLAHGTHLVGMYAPALAVTSVTTSIPGSLTVYLYPRIVHRFGQTGESRAAWRSTRRLVAVNLVLLAALGVAGFFLSPWIVRRFFPAYEEGIFAMQIVSVACVFHGLKAHTMILATLKAWRLYVAYSLLAIVASYGSVVLGLALFEPLTGAAAGMALGVAISGICLALTAKLAFRQHGTTRVSGP